MKQIHSPWTLKDFRGGANTDAEGVAIAGAEGVFRDSRNMRLVSDDGRNGVLTKVGGESLLYAQNVPGASTYHCVGTILVKGRTIEFWASQQPATYAPYLRIDGVVMAQHPDIPYKWDKDLQLHKMEDCDGGIVFDARSGSIPIHWDIGNIMSEYAAGNQTYFSGFSITAYQANPTRPVNRPLFMGLDDIGAGSGMFPGQYHYSIRLVNANGDHTPDGPPLECVMVPVLDDSAPNLPYAGVVGANPTELALRTKWGAKLRFRVNNKANMAFVEIMRTQFILDAGIDQLEDIVIAARIPILPGQNEVLDYVDNGDSVATISVDASVIVTHFIASANSVRYINYHLVYGGVELNKKNIKGVYQGATKTFPVTRKIGTKGHADPVIHCYKRRFQSGERHAVGGVFYLPDGSVSDVDFIENVQLPNRRDPKTGDSDTWSDAPCYAATTNAQGVTKVGKTFEVFDHDNATGKTGSGGYENQYVNVMENGARLFTLDPNQPASLIASDNSGIQDPNVMYSPSGGQSGIKKSVYGIPLRPTSTTDSKVGLDYKVNTHVRNTHNGPLTPYDPQIFNVEHHTLGLALRGVNQPAGTQGFSLVASRPADRVVTQGLARWVIRASTNPSSPMATKEKQMLELSFPDHEGGMLSQTDFDAIAKGSALGGYKLQFVSPLGFASEQYGSAMMLGTDRSLGFLADMMSYARVLWDKGQINPGVQSGINEPQPNGANYFVGFGRYRNGMGNIPWNNGADGNALFDITSAQVVGAGTKLHVTVNQPIYGQDWGGSGEFDEVNTMNFTEPWYVVNIVRDGLQPKRLDGYISCNHYQAYVSEIGVTATQNEQFLLADENLDMIQGRVNDGAERYIYLTTAAGTGRYMNNEGMTAAQYTLALQTLAVQGNFTSPFSGQVVEGMFKVVTSGDDTFIQIDSYAYMGATVEVRYDPRIPAVFYGDRITAPSLAVMVDGYGDVNGPSTNESFIPKVAYDVGAGLGVISTIGAAGVQGYASNTVNPFINSTGCLVTHGMGIPFRNYKYNDKYFVPLGRNPISHNSPGGFFTDINQLSNATIHSVRQWLVVFDCEVKSPLQLSSYDYPVTRTFPQANYRPAPYWFDPNGGFSTAGNGLHGNYTTQGMYGSTPGTLGRGGFTFNSMPISPYRVQPRVRYFERPPQLGEEETNFCDSVIFSEAYSPLKNYTPSLKTFPVNNIKFLPNDTGAIQRLYSNRHGLFALMETGAYHILVQRNVAYSPDGSAQQMFAQDEFLGPVNAVAGGKAIGMPEDWWRTAAEGVAAAGGGQRDDTLFWYDGKTQYMLSAPAAVDIAKGRYRKGLGAASFVPTIAGPHVRKCSAYDKDRDELFVGLFGGTPLYATSPNTNHWYGTTGYSYDKMLHTPLGMLGMKRGETYLMNDGNILNGKPVEGWVKISSAPYPNERMWYRRIKVDSKRKPTRIEFYDENDTLVSWMDAATFGPHYLMKETAWEHWIPLDRVTIAPKKKDLQGRLAYAKVMFQDAGPDEIAFIGTLVVPVK